MLNKKIKAFTISELMITLALTGIMTSFAYMGFNYTQKLLHQFHDQNSFIVQLTELNKRLSLLSGPAKEIKSESEKCFVFRSDSMQCKIDFRPDIILLNRSGNTDTFHLTVTDLKSEFEKMQNPAWEGKLINHIEFYVLFQKEKFRVSFNKKYDAYSKLILETQNN
jgi:prepilin-type N-terminal cleavage/methylation domain-containing protein